MTDERERPGLLGRLIGRRAPGRWRDSGSRPPEQRQTRALGKFVAALTHCESPVIVDLGPVVGANVSFFGERLRCKILVEDLYADLDRATRELRVASFRDGIAGRWPLADGTVDGVLCWDFFDYLDLKSAQALARRLVALVRPGGAILAFFANERVPGEYFTRYQVVDERTVALRKYPSSCARQLMLANRDIERLFAGLRVAESFLMLSRSREVLFRKPAAPLPPSP